MLLSSHSDAQNEEAAAVVTVAVESVSSSFSAVVVVGVESVAVAVVAVESASSSFPVVLVVGAPVVVDLSAVESILSSFLDVVVACCCTTVESTSSSFSVVFVI